jgi:hypothetical protein
VGDDPSSCRRCGADLRGVPLPLLPPAVERLPRHRVVPRWALAVVVLAAALAVGVRAATAHGCRPGRQPGAPQLLDRCSGVSLLVESAGGATLLDLDRGDVMHLPPRRDLASQSLSAGRMLDIDDGQAFAMGIGPPVALGPATGAVDDGTDGWWLIMGNDHPAGSETARPVAGTGPLPGPTILLGPGVTPVGGLDGDLVVANDARRVSVVGGTHPGPLDPDLGPLDVVATSGDVALVRAQPAGRPGGLWLVRPSGGERYVGPATRVVPGAGGFAGARFSPNGRQLAVFLPAANGAQLAVLDVATGAVRPVPGGVSIVAVPAVAWSPDGRWLFFSQGGGPVGWTLGAYRSGDRKARQINYFPPAVSDLMAVATLRGSLVP